MWLEAERWLSRNAWSLKLGVSVSLVAIITGITPVMDDFAGKAAEASSVEGSTEGPVESRATCDGGITTAVALTGTALAGHLLEEEFGAVQGQNCLCRSHASCYYGDPGLCTPVNFDVTCYGIEYYDPGPDADGPALAGEDDCIWCEAECGEEEEQ